MTNHDLLTHQLKGSLSIAKAIQTDVDAITKGSLMSCPTDSHNYMPVYSGTKSTMVMVCSKCGQTFNPFAKSTKEKE